MAAYSSTNTPLQVLGCCILIVFCLGLVRLWWINRALRKLEVLDAEKRSRRSDMSHCGIDAWKAEDIPFGVRAIQRGVEVEGIWISRSVTPESSQVASSATLVGDHGSYSKAKGKTSVKHFGSENRESGTSESGTSHIDEPAQTITHVIQSRIPIPARLRSPTRTQSDSKERQELHDLAPQSNVHSYIPSGSWRQHHSKTEHHAQATTDTTSSAEYNAKRPVHINTAGEANIYGVAKIHANRDTRCPNPGFEILPAGTLGPRQELQGVHDTSETTTNNLDPSQRPEAYRGRLRKKPPLSQLR